MCLALAACGDDDPAPQGAATGTGGGGGQGGDGGEGGGGGPPEARASGEPCTTNDECAGGLCLTEETFGWAAGYCSGLCDPGLLPCEAGSECVPQGSYSLCLRVCGTPADCDGPGQTCKETPEGGALLCVGGCDADEQCQGGCDDDNWRCVAHGEVCDNGKDDDGDALQDCEELDCAAQGACAARIAEACAGAIDVSEGGTFSGTTEGGTSVFGAVCATFVGTYAAGSGMNERVFQFVAPDKGVVTIAARATEGDFDWYVRTGCDKPATLLGCLPAFTADDPPVDVAVEEGDTYVIFIEGKVIEGQEGTDAAYALDVAFTPQICGDGVLVGTEECDDGNAADDDLCTSACKVNAEAVCAAAAPITAGETAAGDASEGTQGFTGSCGGAGGELVYRYTPAASGEVTITATPEGAADIVLYARTDCADQESEIACADNPFDGALAESITVTVTEAEPIDIFVDSYEGVSSGPFTLEITPAE
ncbi:DUF4215 domain-containing protein [Sorangium sp. So ce315]|uniref:DUF4215 domain-containing protein n=1 Tax=Sorangium sp. So ce315 TaxID=3133299 RepID=UPI003F60BAB0